jgi:hypothetical protein
MAEKGESDQISISLPSEAIDMIELGLIPFGLYGKRRATICRALILDMLKSTVVQEHIRLGREKGVRAANTPSNPGSQDEKEPER